MRTGTVNRLRIEPRPEFAKILRVEEPYATPQNAGAVSTINGRFDRLIVQSGTPAAPSVILRSCILGAVACGGTLFVATENLLLTAIFLAIGAFLPVAALQLMRARRQKKMHGQLSVLICVLTDAARAGLGLTNSLELAAIEIPAPLSDEIELAVRRLQMGIGVEAALAELPERTGMVSMQVLVKALGAHERTGCDLVALLDRVAKSTAAQA